MDRNNHTAGKSRGSQKKADGALSAWLQMLACEKPWGGAVLRPYPLQLLLYRAYLMAKEEPSVCNVCGSVTVTRFRISRLSCGGRAGCSYCSSELLRLQLLLTELLSIVSRCASGSFRGRASVIQGAQFVKSCSKQ